MTALAVAGVAVADGVFDAAPPPTAATGTPRTTAPVPPKAEYTIPGVAGWSAPTATPPTSCRLERLPAPGNAPMALVSGADPTGRYIVGRSYPKGGGYQAVLWHNGKGEKVMLPGDLEESLQDVNSTGTAVGWSYLGDSEADNRPVPYARVFSIRNGWATGVATNLLRPAGVNPEPGLSPGPTGSAGRGKDAMTGAVRWNVRTGEVRYLREGRCGAGPDRNRCAPKSASVHNGGQTGRVRNRGRAAMATPRLVRASVLAIARS